MFANLKNPTSPPAEKLNYSFLQKVEFENHCTGRVRTGIFSQDQDQALYTWPWEILTKDIMS